MSSSSYSCPLYIPLYLSFGLLYVGWSFPSWLYVITRSFQLSSLSFSSTTFKNSPGISDRLPEVSKFQYQKILCSKCRISLVSSVLSVQYDGEKIFFCEISLLSWKPGHNFTWTYCVIYNTTIYLKYCTNWSIEERNCCNHLHFLPRFHLNDLHCFVRCWRTGFKPTV